MFWNFARNRVSLAWRMTVWYGLTLLIVVACVLAILYFTLSWHIDREMISGLEEMIQEIHHKGLMQRELPEEYQTIIVRIQGPGQGKGNSYENAKLSPQLAKKLFPATPGSRPTLFRSEGKTYDLFTLARDGWDYHLAVDRSPVDEIITQLRTNIAWVIVPTIIVALILGYVLARMGMRPLQKIVAEMNTISAEKWQARLSTRPLPSELSNLAGSFNAVIDRLQAAYTKLDDFSANVAHELRTPIHNLRQNTEVLLLERRGLEEYQQSAGRVLEETERLSRLIDRLLILARVADPRQELARQHVDVVKESLSLHDFFFPAALEKGVTMQHELPSSLFANVDPTLMQRALSNLISNAIAATPSGGKVVVKAYPQDTGFCWQITDTGCGISEDAIPHLFDRFYRSPQAKESGRGVGLGLAIVKRVIDLHQATITIESKLGVGTKVLLFFPANNAG
jgi:two-component system, OmpR family, heavy metal sensor histidine kinase CusS